MFVQKKRGPSEDDEQDDANELAWLRARSRPFSQPYGLGANGLAGLFLGGIGGAHAVLLVQSLAAPRRIDEAGAAVISSLPVRASKGCRR